MQRNSRKKQGYLTLGRRWPNIEISTEAGKRNGNMWQRNRRNYGFTWAETRIPQKKYRMMDTIGIATFRDERQNWFEECTCFSDWIGMWLEMKE
jgi:hypothetical protein